ncbi:heterokaryon incompatibility protein-domain-containing protein [Lasiosphaeria miniovina]|uniref:Heterokaryon incompatibility protein-domain-containing protein n=1 Tax=Lasiosphaeria miniovina TaxID=1954250 RepID=A0AA40AD84_9PEZI|nr:heterokaryon incompatibility protein-domain-containing protein [Lasiosphaeria miniovina]KAK0713670.1 heterokaryon incompatibility protein-domain-containing protein [Lasiosphaeria miniovina]
MDSTSSTLAGDGQDESELCPRCLELELAPEKFIIDNAPGAPSHRALTYRPRSGGSPFANFSLMQQLNSGAGPRRLGTLSQLRDNRNCPLCILIVSAIERYGSQPRENSKQDCICYWEWSVDGRQTRPGFQQRSNATRRLRISWSFSLPTTNTDEIPRSSSSGSTSSKPEPPTREHPQHEVYLLFVQPKNSRVQASNALDILDPGKEFQGRDFSHGGIQALITKWIDICEHKHGATCGPIEGIVAFHHLMQQTSFGVIDVVKLQLTELPYDGDISHPHRYVALSYVWGPRRPGDGDHRTLRNNIYDRIRRGGLDGQVFDMLPRTIRDAIRLVRDLGERYLWIDSLCIVQDSDTSWQQNAKNMDLIYGNAHFTICAADGGDADVGLVAAGFGADKSPDALLKETILPGLELLVSRPLEEVVHSSTWNSRAWTFQERILSRRCLVFVEGRVYFQCRGANMSQDVYPGGLGNEEVWSLDWRDSPLRTLRDAKERPIWFYMKCVSLYTGRRLTLPKDIIPAFTGVSQLMARYMGAPFFYCLPASHFDFALLWQPSRAQKRRAREAWPKTTKAEGTLRDDWFDHEEFPSWSWAGWMDREDPQKGAHVTYDAKFLDGCLINIHDWLINRTWIDWNIRDGDGNIKNVWNDYSETIRNRQQPRQPETDRIGGRWSGYQPITSESAQQERERVAREQEIRVRAEHEREFIQRERREQELRVVGRGRHGQERQRQLEQPPEPSPGREVVININNELYQPPSPERPSSRYSDREGGGFSDSQSYRSMNYEPRVRITERVIAPPPPLPPPEVPCPPLTDRYGRPIRYPNMDRRLAATIADNPFGIRQSQQRVADASFTLPILQFHTWSSNFYVLDSGSEQNFSETLGEGLARCHVADQSHDWCGTVVLDREWTAAHGGTLCRFIALSEAKSFTADECTHWAHYIAKDRDEIEWDLFHVLLVTYNNRRLLWERVGVGKVLQQAFDMTKESWTEILLG